MSVLTISAARPLLSRLPTPDCRLQSRMDEPCPVERVRIRTDETGCAARGPLARLWSCLGADPLHRGAAARPAEALDAQLLRDGGDMPGIEPALPGRAPGVGHEV